MPVLTARRLAAGSLAVLAIAGGGLMPARAAAGTFTQILCADPVSHAGVIPDGQLPDGLTNPAHHASMGQASTMARCTSGTGIPLSPGTTTSSPNSGGALVYRAAEGLSFRSATIYRRYVDTGNWSLFVHRAADWASPYAAPWDERCDPGCTSLGDGGTFSAANRKVITAGSETTEGFSLAVLCEIPDASWQCAADASKGLRLFGGTVTLSDGSSPQISGAAIGDLVEHTTLAGPEEVTVNATDAGSGLYRVRVLLDGVERLVQPVDSNDGRCADALPGDPDPHQFLFRVPCRTAAGGTYQFDTTALPEGPVNLKVQVEDAAGNATTLVNHDVTVDNILAPSVTTAGTLSGAPRRGNGLALSSATWDAHGSPSALTVARHWQRCLRDGSACADIAGADGLTYTLTAADLNRRLRVVEVASNAEGSGQAVTPLTDVVVREDGTLPTDNDGVDNDGDGQVDEPGETAPAPAGDGGAGGGTDRPSSAGAFRLPAGSSASRSPDGAGSAGGVNGEGASRSARLSVAFVRGGMTTAKLRYGRSAAVGGRLVDEHGRPIRNAIIDVVSTPGPRGARAAAGQPIVTGADGSFRTTLGGAGGSRTVRFEYRYLREGDVVSDGAVKVSVQAGVSFSARLRGIVVRYSGRVLAAELPTSGKLVVVQGRSRGGAWQTFATRRARKAGKFSGRYRLKVRRPGARLQFRVRVLGESGWNYGAVTSKTVTRKVR